MKNSKYKSKLINLFIVLAIFCFGGFLYRIFFLATATEVDGVNLKDFATSRMSASVIINAKRGEIYDVGGNPLAQNVSSYTLIAYLDPSRSEGENKLYHVKDKEVTAKALATVINMSYENILDILNTKDVYQVEFGVAGKNLTEIQKDSIVALNLPGIDFVSDTRRYYPNGDFASYAIGYARNNEDGKTTGEMGIESLLDDVLSGTNGYREYQKDLNGYKIPGTAEYGEDAVNGNNVYLTIDSNIQLIVQQALTKAKEKSSFDWMDVIVADAKTGAILAMSQSPSFDPNKLDITNWVDFSSQQAFEPGSIMKIYTYMAAMEKGTYKGDQTYLSGKYTADDGTTMYDWNKTGFGDITYDQGFLASSNTGVINILNNFIDKDDLYSYMSSLGFGSKTGITLPREDTGSINFTYQTEVYNASFGQGVTTTPIQHIQALTSIANDGVLLRPYIIDKVVDSNNNVVYSGGREELKTVATHETVENIKNLMYGVVHSDWYAATGGAYNVSGADLIGKTGTAQLVNETTGQYYTSDYYTTRSFVGMWPKDDPEVIIYASVRKTSTGTSAPLTTAVDEIVKNVSSYLNIFTTQESSTNNVIVNDYLNKKAVQVKDEINRNGINVVIIGTGDKVVDQYPNKQSVINRNDKIILFTNDASTYLLPDLTGYSKNEVQYICDVTSLKCSFDNYGYVITQSITPGTIIEKNKELKITFKELY